MSQKPEKLQIDKTSTSCDDRKFYERINEESWRINNVFYLHKSANRFSPHSTGLAFMSWSMTWQKPLPFSQPLYISHQLYLALVQPLERFILYFSVSLQIHVTL